MATTVETVLEQVYNAILQAFPGLAEITIGEDSDIMSLTDDKFPRVEISAPVIDTQGYVDQYNVRDLLILGIVGYDKRVTMDRQDIYKQIQFGMKMRATIFGLADKTAILHSSNIDQLDAGQRVVFDYELVNNVMGFEYIVPIQLTVPFLKE